jgi:hypothetical protein
MILIDILFSVGSIGFIFADLKQVWKLFRIKRKMHKFHTDISRTHIKLKLLSLICVLLAYWLSSLPVAFTICLMQFLLNIWILKRIGWK